MECLISCMYGLTELERDSSTINENIDVLINERILYDLK